MSRYVDISPIENEYLDEGEVYDYVFNAPSIDIVRCRECKYWIDDRKAEEDMGTCGLTHYFTNADDFCSYGVRDSEKPNNSTTDCMRCKLFWNCDGQCDEQTERSE